MSDDFERIKNCLLVLCGTFGKRMDAQTTLFWATELEKHSGPRLWTALASALRSEAFPTLRWLLDHAVDPSTQPGRWKEPEPLTPQQKRKSDHAAIMSMLWMRYNYGHDSLGFMALARMFPGDANKALVAAQEVYPMEVVNKWMENQQAIGN